MHCCAGISAGKNAAPYIKSRSATVDPRDRSADILRAGLNMIGRSLLAALIALSVAMVPAVGGAAALSNSADMAMSDRADMLCCKTVDDCKNPAACALKCFNYSDVILLPVALLPRTPDIKSPMASEALRGFVGRPPTHPPPV